MDDYSDILLKALADRLAERCARPVVDREMHPGDGPVHRDPLGLLVDQPFQIVGARVVR
ncbi:hypothetical protein, partial [Acinetobacter baumannii]|uniref:hypothetical protein n=1 Tax=Acinetobacter baumannii TaxID=470 RepID=UPI0034D417D4